MIKIKDHIENTINIDKSTFITNLYRVDNVDDAKTILEQIRMKYSDANHNCYAYILENGLIQKCSDDNEPSQTAGYPMLDVLKKQDITNIIAITTRYFGGIKLGAGGLVRAYSKSVSEALLLATFTQEKQFNKYTINFDYSLYNNISKLENINIIDSSFEEKVSVTFLVEEQNNDIIIEKIKNLTLGKVSIQFIEQVKLDL